MPKINMGPGVEEIPISDILARIIQQNLEQRPEKLKGFNAMNVGVGMVMRDYDIKMTLRFEKGELTLYKGLEGNPEIVVDALDSDILLEMPNIKIRFGVPYPFDKLGMSVFKKLINREIRIKGLLSHPVASLRLIKVLSVA